MAREENDGKSTGGEMVRRNGHAGKEGVYSYSPARSSPDEIKGSTREQYHRDRSIQHLPTPNDHTPDEAVMNSTPSRDEIAARLEAAEARTEARFAQLTGTLDVRFANLDNKMDRLGELIERLSAEMGGVKAEMVGVKADNKFTRWTIVGVVVASILAGLAAIWVTQGNMLAAFQASLAVRTMQSGPPTPSKP